MVSAYWIERIEIIFWTYAISLMSQSRIVQFIVPYVYPLFQNRLRLKWFAQVALWGLAGLFIGMAFGFLRGRLG